MACWHDLVAVNIASGAQSVVVGSWHQLVPSVGNQQNGFKLFVDARREAVDRMGTKTTTIIIIMAGAYLNSVGRDQYEMTCLPRCQCQADLYDLSAAPPGRIYSPICCSMHRVRRGRERTRVADLLSFSEFLAFFQTKFPVSTARVYLERAYWNMHSVCVCVVDKCRLWLMCIDCACIHRRPHTLQYPCARLFNKFQVCIASV